MKKRQLVPAFGIGVPFGLLFGGMYALESSTGEAIVAGLVAALVTIVGIAGYELWRERRFKAWAAIVCAPYEGEGIIHHGYAVLGSTFAALVYSSLFGAADHSGVLVLTKQRMQFVPRRSNAFAKQSGIAVTDIIGVRPAPYFGASTITVHTRAQQSVDIKVHERAEWLARLAASGVKVIDPALKAH